MKTYRLFVFLSRAITGIATSTILYAQESTPELDPRYTSWYQVEIIVFERLYNTTGNEAEALPKNIDLNYPASLTHLFTQEEWQTHITPPLTEEPTQTDNTLITSLNPSDEKPIDATNIDDERALNDMPSSPMEISHIKLDQTFKVLNKQASTLAKRSAYRVLFHEAWRQPLTSRKSSRSIVITGGNEFDEHYELEGSVLIGVDRYLHIETNLWRTQFELNYGQQENDRNINGSQSTLDKKIEYWPILPTLPRPNSPFSSETNTALEVNTNFDLNTHLTTSQDSVFTLGNTDPLSELTITPYVEIKKSPYVVKEIIQLQQTRRMRSNETHYLDHPHLGLIVRITPYEVALPEPITEVQIEQPAGLNTNSQ